MDFGGLSPDELRMFIDEAQEQVQLLDEGIIRLEREPDDVELLNRIFRAAHTLKGSSGMIGFDAMARLTHSMEDVLDRVRKHSLSVTPDLVDALLRSLDGLKKLCEIPNKPGESSFDVTDLVAALTRLVTSEPEAAQLDGAAEQTDLGQALDAQSAARAEEATSKGLSVYRAAARITSGSEWAAVRSYQVVSVLSSAGEVISSDPSQAEIEAQRAREDIQVLFASTWSEDDLRQVLSEISDVEVTTLAAWQQPRVAAGAAAPEDSEPPDPDATAELGSPRIEALQTVRIDVGTLDALMDMVGELVIDRTRLAQISRALSSNHREDEMVSHLTTTTSHLAKVIDELNQEMMQARMLPVGTLFNKFPRMVRDLSRSLGKDIDFVIGGAETEIDRSVIDKIKDPIVHMLRNAVDHGVEGPEERLGAGKAAAASIRLTAHQEQGHIFITISDDGRGINAQRVKEVAVQRGVINSDAAERLSDREALDLIFEAGFSTARSTTEVSGRGVGMDVVQKSITELGGAVSVETEVGQGSTFVLRLPLTLATFQGLLVSAGGTAFAIPISFVQETLLLDEESTQSVMGAEVLNLRGQGIPLLRLDAESLLGKDVGSTTTTTRFVVVLKADNKLLGLVVDNLLEQQEVVVKPIGRLASRVRGIAGASILGDGRVALILDTSTLLRATSFGAGAPGEPERIAA